MTLVDLPEACRGADGGRLRQKGECERLVSDQHEMGSWVCS